MAQTKQETRTWTKDNRRFYSKDEVRSIWEKESVHHRDYIRAHQEDFTPETLEKLRQDTTEGSLGGKAVADRRQETFERGFGSLGKWIELEGYKGLVPEAGMGVTIHHYSDADAGTITRISKSGKCFWYTIDDAVLDPDFKPDFVVGGFAGHCTNQHEQTYTYTTVPGRQEKRATLCKDGRFKSTCMELLTIGYRGKFYDYNF